MKGALLVGGTSSDAGKSAVVTGICRLLARTGVKVAPFKAQNMSLNSIVTPDGAEIGRAQAAQAAAARVVPEAAMNPVLLKPGSERSSQVVVMGRAMTVTDAMSYQELSRDLLPVVAGALESLRARFDVVICEGAGSVGEFNLREHDLANMGLAHRAQLPVVIVSDIDRGGALSGLVGCLAVLDPTDQALVSGFLLNKFRGDKALLDPGIERLEALTGRPTLGVLPWLPRMWVDAEDSVALASLREPLIEGVPRAVVRIAVVRLPRISNFTDFDALASEPGVFVSFTTSPAEILNSDLAIVPGTKATVEDLAWLRSSGAADALRERAALNLPTLGICGGYQMLGKRIVDEVESHAGEVDGLGLLPVETVFAQEKILTNRAGQASAFAGSQVSGYEIRHGRVTRFGGDAVIQMADGDEGCIEGSVVGISWHGVTEGDPFRRALLGWVSDTCSLEWTPGTHSFAQLREDRLNRLGDLIEHHVDTGALVGLIEKGPFRGLPQLDARLLESAHGLDENGTASKRDLRSHGDRMVPPGAKDFAVNVVAGGPPDWLRRNLTDTLPRVSQYPDPSAAKQSLGERHDRSPAEVLPTNGAAEAFWLIAAALRPRRAAVVHPSFTEPEVALRALGMSVSRVFRREDDFGLDSSGVPSDCDVVFVCNPNNPTGTLDPAETLRRLAGPDRIVVVDEAFMEFCIGERESLSNGPATDGILVIRSVTKLFAVPGVRAGYVLGGAPLIERLEAVRQPWSVNVLALSVLEACASHRQEGELIAAETRRKRGTLVSDLQDIPSIRVWPSEANFVLVEVPDGVTVCESLLEKGFAVRPCETFPGLSADYLRIAVGSDDDNRALVEALESSVG
jgi:adenosylcobyric acid synthase